jgi:hypothetical protein
MLSLIHLSQKVRRRGNLYDMEGMILYSDVEIT